jgi:hypothetical protein
VSRRHRSPDGDGDGVCDSRTTVRTIADPAQADTDGDGIGDACDPVHEHAAGHRDQGEDHAAEARDAARRRQVQVHGYMVVPETPRSIRDNNGVRVLLHDSTGSDRARRERPARRVRRPESRRLEGERLGHRVHLQERRQSRCR